jgi:uncharacterized protein YegL
MKQNLTDVTVVLDRSGSMSTVVSDVEGSLNAFISQQKKVKGEAKFTLIQFDNDYEVVFDAVNIQKVDKVSLLPRGCTALLDAIGKTINKTGERLSNTSEENRPSKVVVVVLTDGQENASKEFKKEQIFEMIKHQREKYSWEILFLAANEDAINTAVSYGFSVSNSASYKHTANGYKNMFNTVSANLTAVRCCASATMGFSGKDRNILAKE